MTPTRKEARCPSAHFWPIKSGQDNGEFFNYLTSPCLLSHCLVIGCSFEVNRDEDEIVSGLYRFEVFGAKAEH